MRKLPRRLPSNSPSLAWVGFALLLLCVGGGLAGLYAHRQNQEAAKRTLIEELQRDIAKYTQQLNDHERQYEERKEAGSLTLKIKQHKLELHPIPAGERILVADWPPIRPASDNGGSAPSSAASTSPSVMATVTHP